MYDYSPAIIIIIIMIIMIIIVMIMLFTTMVRALRRDRLGLPAEQVGRAHVLLQQGSACARACSIIQANVFILRICSKTCTWSGGLELGRDRRASARNFSEKQLKKFPETNEERSFGKLLSSLASLLGSFLQLPSSARF